MNFNNHFNLKGEHAFLSPSHGSWINYDMDKLRSAYFKSLARKKGLEIHDFARRCIELGIRLPKTKKALNLFVNDAIGYRMFPEQILFYSRNVFGTADAICFRNNLLRIHDLKTGLSPVKMVQLEIYAALFCLEYKFDPKQIDIELRIYQTTSIVVHEPHHSVIQRIIKKISLFDRKIEEYRSEI